MQRRSAGILMYRRKGRDLEVFLVHPGGPIWAHKDAASWTIPKGEFEKDEEPLAAAIREFQEETSFPAKGDFIDLGVIKQKSGNYRATPARSSGRHALAANSKSQKSIAAHGSRLPKRAKKS
jgi:predicted NUDIX family NTP pyrophosphohydrolase